MKEYLEIGKIINKRGLKGELKIENYCDDLDTLCKVKRVFLDEDGKNELKVISAKQYKQFGYFLLETVDSAEKADAIRGKVLYAHRDEIDIDEGKHFIVDIIGLSVYDADTNRCYGVLSDVFNVGASDIYSITKDGKEYLIPAVPEIVIDIDLDKGIFVRPIAGMFDEAEEV